MHNTLYVILKLTEFELADLVGYVAAEANHAKNPQDEDDLSNIFEYLEGVESSIKFKA